MYNHQCKAINVLRNNKNCIITTPTASGKTLAFSIPIFESLEQNRDATALFLYPTKALTHDQLNVLREFERISGIKIKPETYDGDTPTNKRPKIRSTSRIIISNPYELHQILPWHSKWHYFLPMTRGKIWSALFIDADVFYLSQRILCTTLRDGLSRGTRTPKDAPPKATEEASARRSWYLNAQKRRRTGRSAPILSSATGPDAPATRSWGSIRRRFSVAGLT